MPGAALVNVNLDLRIQLEKRTGGAGMVEMDMRQHELADIPDGNSLRGQRLEEPVERRRRPRIDERDAARPL